MRSIVAALALVLSVASSSAGAGRDKAGGADGDWYGWWFIYHRDLDGRLVLDKFTKAMVIWDKPFPRYDFTATGQWVGCVWLPVTKYV